MKKLLLILSLGLLSVVARADSFIITSTITVTNVANLTNNVSSLTVNGIVRTWVSTVTNTPNNILISTNATIGADATNLFLAFAMSPQPSNSTTLSRSGTNAIALRFAQGVVSTITLTAGWGTVTNATNAVTSAVDVTIPLTVIPADKRTNITSGLIDWLNLGTTSVIATNAPGFLAAFSYWASHGTVTATNAIVKDLNGIATNLTDYVALTVTNTNGASITWDTTHVAGMPYVYYLTTNAAANEGLWSTFQTPNSFNLVAIQDNGVAVNAGRAIQAVRTGVSITDLYLRSTARVNLNAPSITSSGTYISPTVQNLTETATLTAQSNAFFFGTVSLTNSTGNYQTTFRNETGPLMVSNITSQAGLRFGALSDSVGIEVNDGFGHVLKYGNGDLHVPLDVYARNFFGGGVFTNVQIYSDGFIALDFMPGLRGLYDSVGVISADLDNRVLVDQSGMNDVLQWLNNVNVNTNLIVGENLTVNGAFTNLGKVFFRTNLSVAGSISATNLATNSIIGTQPNSKTITNVATFDGVTNHFLNGAGQFVSSSGGGGSQTPWTSTINGGGYFLTNASLDLRTNTTVGTPSGVTYTRTNLGTGGYASGNTVTIQVFAYKMFGDYQVFSQGYAQSATVTTNNSFDILWNISPVAGADGYEVFMDNSAGLTFPCLNPAVTNLPYLDDNNGYACDGPYSPPDFPPANTNVLIGLYASSNNIIASGNFTQSNGVVSLNGSVNIVGDTHAGYITNSETDLNFLRVFGGYIQGFDSGIQLVGNSYITSPTIGVKELYSDIISNAPIWIGTDYASRISWFDNTGSLWVSNYVYANEGFFTNAITLNGVEITNWPVVHNTLIQTNFVGGQLYTNQYGSMIQVSCSAALTTAAVAGLAQLSLEVPGQVTNRASLLTAIGVVTGVSTNAMAVTCVPSGSTYKFVNTSSGAGDSATPVGGQIWIP